MKKSMLVILVLITSVGMVWAGRKKLDAQTRSGMTKVVKTYNYMCGECTEGFFDGGEPEGLAFTVVCDDYAYVYKVVLRPDDTFIVQPK